MKKEPSLSLGIVHSGGYFKCCGVHCDAAFLWQRTEVHEPALVCVLWLKSYVYSDSSVKCLLDTVSSSSLFLTSGGCLCSDS